MVKEVVVGHMGCCLGGLRRKGLLAGECLSLGHPWEGQSPQSARPQDV